MDRVVFLQHRGRKVLLLDYRDLHDEKTMLAMVAERSRLVAAEVPGTVLTLADLTGARFTKEAITAIKLANAREYSLVLRAAIVGADQATPKHSVEAVDTFSSREHVHFANREDALDWLVSSGNAARP